MIAVVKKSITSLTLVGLVASSASLHAISMPSFSKVFSKESVATVGSLTLFALWFRFFTKKGGAQAEGGIQDALAGDNIIGNLTNEIDNTIIGQPEKKLVVKVDSESGVAFVDSTEKQEASGVFGYIESHVKPFSKALGFTAGSLIVLAVMKKIYDGEICVTSFPMDVVNAILHKGGAKAIGLTEGAEFAAKVIPAHHACAAK